MGPRAGTLPALEVPVRRRGHPLARTGDVVVHAQAHRASGAAPLEPGVAEDPVEALGLGLGLDSHRSGHGERADTASTGMSRMAVPGRRPMYASARRALSRPASSASASGSGIRLSIATACAG